MKVINQKLFAHLFLLSTLFVGGRAPAHDFPSAGSLASEQFASECFGESDHSGRNAPEAAHRQPCPFVISTATFTQWTRYGTSLAQSLRWQNALAKLAGKMDALLRFPSTAAAETSEATTAENHELWVAAPLQGEAPAPGVAPQVKQEEIVAIGPRSVRFGKRPFIEDYMPYDFSIRDWRFGQFPINKDTSVTCNQVLRAETELESEFASENQAGVPTLDDALLQRITQFVATLSQQVRQQFSSNTSVRDWTERLSVQQRIKLSQGVKRAGKYVAAITAPKDLAPLFANPQFVIYHDAAGTSIVLTTEQARNWKLDAQPTLAVEQVAFESASVCPFARSATNQLLDAVGAQLESTGSALIAASRWLSNFTGSRIAENTGNDIR